MRFRHYPLILCLVLLLSSCSHLGKQDGPPKYDVDVSGIPNAVPKPEPLAKYGNYKSYVVFGKRYYTLANSRNYDQVGTASWYGSKFHARKTSSGETYDMLSMTAAHKTLPLPTYVEVTNLANNSKIIVKVNDRGPFESNRIIDLSYVAAKKLGMLGRGTANVRVRALNPNTWNQREPFFAATSPASADIVSAENKPKEKAWPGFKPIYQHTKPVYLQVGAFANKRHALKLQKQLASLYRLPVRIINPTARQKLYKVKIGPLRNITAINKITAQLRGLGITPNKTYGA